MADYPDFEGQKVGIYLIPDWAARLGEDKNIVATDTDKARGEYVVGSYSVPNGSTLYITQVFFTCFATNAVDSDKLQMASFNLFIALTGQQPTFGGNGGGHATLPKPRVIAGGSTVNVRCTNRANHNCDLEVGFMGYEVS